MKRNARIWLVAALAVMLLLVSAAPAFSAPGDTVRVWVKSRPGQQVAVQRTLESAGAQFHYTFPELEAHVVTLPSAALAGIANNPNVAYVEDDVPRELLAGAPAEAYAEALAMLAASQTTPYGIERVQAPQVWPTTTGAGRTLCIVDTGLYTGHEDFAGVNVVGGYSQIAGQPWNSDGHGHGTHVAGTAAAANNSVGVVGVAPGVSLYIVKVFNDSGAWTLSSNLVDAIYRCRDAGANVISMSLGGSSSSTTERNAFESLYTTYGILSVAAAGNGGSTAYSYPASYDAVISVAATDQNNALASFSQRNNQVELAAPGVNVLSSVPFAIVNALTVDGATYSGNYIENAARGTATGQLASGGLCNSTNAAWSGRVVLCERGSISFYDKVLNVQNSGGVATVIYNNTGGNFSGTLGSGNSSAIPAISLSQADGQYLVANKIGASGTVASLNEKPGSGYEAWSGTSMATPHVSAVAALVWSANTAWTNAQIRAALQQTALDLGPAGRDNSFGYGLVQAAAALQLLQGSPPPPPPPPPTPTPTPTLTPTPTPTATPPEAGGIVLTGSGTKVKGVNTANLSWSGASGAVDIFRNGGLLAGNVGGSSYADNTGTKGKTTFTYRVCEAGGTTTCSNEVTISW